MTLITIAAFLLLLLALDGLAVSSLANFRCLSVAPAKHALPGAIAGWGGSYSWNRAGVSPRPQVKGERQRHG
jgi:hypothetical protein